MFTPTRTAGTVHTTPTSTIATRQPEQHAVPMIPVANADPLTAFGDFPGAHEHFHKTVELYDQARHGDFANRFGHDPRRRWLEILRRHHIMGAGSNSNDSLRLADRALADAEAAAHAPTMGQALAMAALLGLVRRNPEAVATYGQASADIVARYDLPGNWAAVFFQGWAKLSEAAKGGDSPRCDAASPSFGSEVRFGSCLDFKRRSRKPRRAPARLMPRSGAWTTRSPNWSAPSSAGTKRSYTASAARSCCSATRPIPRRPSSLCRRQSLSRSRRKRGASNCAPRWLWQSFITRPIATPMRTPRSRRRSRVSRQPNNSPKLMRRTSVPGFIR